MKKQKWTIIFLMMIALLALADMTYVGHKIFSKEQGQPLFQNLVVLSNGDEIIGTNVGASVHIEGNGWEITLEGVTAPCLDQYNDVITCAVMQHNDATIGDSVYVDPPDSKTYPIIFQIDSEGNILSSIRGEDHMILSDMAANEYGFAIVGWTGTEFEGITSPFGGGLFAVYNGSSWTGKIFERPTNGGSPTITSIQSLPNGNWSLGGTIDGGDVFFGHLPVDTFGGTDAFCGIMQSDGTAINVVSFGGSSNETEVLQTVMTDGTVMISGRYNSEMTIPNYDGTVAGTLPVNPVGNSFNQMFCLIYSASGFLIDAYSTYIDGESLLNIDLEHDENFFYAYFGSNGGTIVTPTGSHSEIAPVLLKFDPNGTALWSKQVTGTNIVHIGQDIFIKNGIVYILATENNTANIDFNGGTVEVTDATYVAKYDDSPFVQTLSLSPSSITVGDRDGNTTFDIMSDAGWNRTNGPTWCDLTITSGDETGNATINVAYNANDGAARTDSVVVEALLSGEKLAFVITQDAPVSPDPQFSTTLLTVTEEALVAFINETTTGSAAIDTYRWTFGDGGVSNESNPIYAYSNSGTYTVSLEVTDINGLSAIETKTDYITVVAQSLDITPESETVPASAGGVSIDITSNGPWSITENSEWISLSNYSGSGDQRITASHTATDTTGLRSGEITILATVSGATKVFTLNQAGASMSIDFYADSTEVDSGLVIQFTSDVNCTAGNVSVVSWLWNFDDPDGVDGGFSTEENPAYWFHLVGLHDVTLQAVLSDGTELVETKVAFMTINTGIEESNLLPVDTKISNYPNPFNPTTTLNLQANRNVEWTFVGIYNANGQLVQSVNVSRLRGSRQIELDMSNQHSGTYFLRTISEENGKSKSLTRKLMLLK